MFVVRTAMMILAACLLRASLAQGGLASEPPATSATELALHETESPIECFLALPVRPTNSFQFVLSSDPTKIVLSETDREVLEEVDLGPVLNRDRHIYSAPRPWTSCPVPATSRLRC